MNDYWEYVLQSQDDGKKYQEILAHRFHFSRRLLQKLKQGERAWVNGKFTYLNARGKVGDRLTLALCGDDDAANMLGEDLPLEILYEDDYLLAVNKPSGQVIHPIPRYPDHTLGNAVAAYWQRQGNPRPFRPIHRIDRNTSGLVLIAKNRFTHQQLAWQMEHGQVEKTYLGFISGHLSEPDGKWDAPIGLAEGSYILRTVRYDSHGLPALTHYRTLKSYKQASLLQFILATGRTHQIRVHCQFAGHPLLGDELYGGDTSKICRQALHSFRYRFIHPATGTPITIKAPLPLDLRQLAVSISS